MTAPDKFGKRLKVGDWILALCWLENRLTYGYPTIVLQIEKGEYTFSVIANVKNQNGFVQKRYIVSKAVEKLPKNEKKRDQLVFLRMLGEPEPYV
jgi:hypothetical protein